MPIPDRFEIGSSKDLVDGVIFGVEYLILARKTKMLGGNGVFWVYVWLFRGSDGAPDGQEWLICQSQIGVR